MRRNWTRWIAISLLLAAVLDVASTYIASPDLSREANPLTTAFGQTWLNVFAIKFIGSLGCLLIFSCGLHTLHSRRKRLSGLSGFWCVMSHLIYKRQMTASAFLLRGGIRDMGAYLSLIAVCITMGVLLGSVAASMSNSLKLIQSYSAAIAFWCIAGVLGTALGAMMTYRFLAADNEAE